MEERIDSRKLNFIYHLKTLDESTLANEVFEQQRKYNFPGLVLEGRKLLTKYGLPNIIDGETKLSRSQWKSIVRRKVKEYSEDRLTFQFQEYSKLREGPLVEGGLEVKPYIDNLKMHEARTMFRIRTKMMPAKMNMKSNQRFARELWKCDASKMMDSQSHVLWCPFLCSTGRGQRYR